MQQAIFDGLLDEIYAAFGRTRPAFGSAQYRMLWRKLCDENHVPDRAAKAIAYAIADYDSLPSNLSKACLSEWHSWLNRNPQFKARERQNQFCHKCKHTGSYTGWDRETLNEVWLKCECNHEDWCADHPAWTPETIEASGIYTLVEPDWLEIMAQHSTGHAQAPMQTHMQGLMAGMGQQAEDAWLDF